MTPLIIWLVDNVFKSQGHELPAVLILFFSGTAIFSLSAFYEIIELWDEVYFNGQRIWSTHDTATDLQWDLIGILIGSLVSSVLLRVRSVQPQVA